MRRPHLSRRAATMMVVLVATVALVLYWMRPKPIDVDTAVVTRGPMRVTVDDEGRTRVRNRFDISAPVAGELRRLTLHEGQVIRHGQVVAWIAPLPLDETTRRQGEAQLASARARAAEAQAQVRQTSAAVVQARRTLERRDALLAAGAIASEVRELAALDLSTREEEASAARARAIAAVAEVETARAALIALSRSPGTLIPVRAPAQGQVLRIPEMSERVIAAGTAILELGDDSSLEVIVDLLTEDAVRTCAGQRVELAEWGGERVLRGRVRRVEPSAFTKVSALGVDEQRVRVVIDLLQPASALGDAYRVEARIIVWESPNVLRVPSTALVQRGQAGWSVFVVENGRARSRSVDVDHRTSTFAEVIAGLREGDVVILFPSDEVHDGTRVRSART